MTIGRKCIWLLALVMALVATRLIGLQGVTIALAGEPPPRLGRGSVFFDPYDLRWHIVGEDPGAPDTVWFLMWPTPDTQAFRLDVWEFNDEPTGFIITMRLTFSAPDFLPYFENVLLQNSRTDSLRGDVFWLAHVDRISPESILYIFMFDLLPPGMGRLCSILLSNGVPQQSFTLGTYYDGIRFGNAANNEYYPVVVGLGQRILGIWRDADCNGLVDILDIVKTINHVYFGVPLVGECSAVDVDSNRMVDMVDIVLTIQCVMYGDCPWY